MRRLLIFLMILPGILNGQKRNLETKLDTSSIKIGERASLMLMLDLESGVNVVFQEWPDSVQGLELSSISTRDTFVSKESGKSQLRFTYYLTSFDSGYYVIPPLSVVVTTDSEKDSLFSEPLLIRAIIPEVDTTDVIHDIYDPYRIPYSWQEILEIVWPYLTGILLIVVLIILTRKFAGKKQSFIPEEMPVIDPEIWALEELQGVERMNFLAEGKFKAYHIEISDILRKYLELRIQVPALERTTDELMEELARKGGIKDFEKQILRDVLKQSDRVKFAKYVPDRETSERLYSNSVLFIGKMKSELDKMKLEKTDLS